MPLPTDDAARATKTPNPAPERSRAALWIAAAALLGFLGGFLLQNSRLQSTQAELATSSRALHAARLEATLSAAVIEAQSGRYEVARQHASDFYTGLQRRLLPVMASAQQEEARTMLAERDSLITSLARNDPMSSGALASVLVRLRETIRRAELDAPVDTTASGE